MLLKKITKLTQDPIKLECGAVDGLRLHKVVHLFGRASRPDTFHTTVFFATSFALSHGLCCHSCYFL